MKKPEVLLDGLTFPEGPRWHPIVTAIFIAMILLTFRYHSCPHAYTLWFGPVGISYSDYGGPCHNRPHRGGKHLTGNWYRAASPATPVPPSASLSRPTPSAPPTS